jgi:hypothetical protein
MQLSVFSHFPATGWSMPPDPALDSERTLIVAFGPSGLVDAPGALDEMLEMYPCSRVLGCSTSGEIHGNSIHDDSLTVAVARFDKVQLREASANVTAAENSFDTGESIGRQLLADDLRAVLIFSDGLLVNGSELVRGLNSILPQSVVVSGGLAGDGDRFQRTWVLDGRRLHAGRVSAVGLYGSGLKVGHGSKGGWDAFGVERKVTRSAGNVLYELDGRPALELYKEYLGERATGLPATALLFPLTLWADGDDEKKLVRTILAVNEADQSMTFAGDIPEGYCAQLMYANFDRLVQGAGEAALVAGNIEGAGDMLSIAVSCVGRRLVLGDRAEEEIEATSDVLPQNVRQIGFYSYGEISPYAGGHCDLHNQTMTLTTLMES